jgi:hypothetical protein
MKPTHPPLPLATIPLPPSFPGLPPATPQEFLVLVMDLVPAGDLSEFVLTKKRLNADQARGRSPTRQALTLTLSGRGVGSALAP